MWLPLLNVFLFYWPGVGRRRDVSLFSSFSPPEVYCDAIRPTLSFPNFYLRPYNFCHGRTIFFLKPIRSFFTPRSYWLLRILPAEQAAAYLFTRVSDSFCSRENIPNLCRDRSNRMSLSPIYSSPPFFQKYQLLPSFRKVFDDPIYLSPQSKLLCCCSLHGKTQTFPFLRTMV